MPTSAVHPHARGDDSMGHSFRSWVIGSPPRAWGRREHATRFDAVARFTPTRVGTTATLSAASPSRSVHPHARGDDASEICAPFVIGGSPPRAWGRRTPPAGGIERCRFTPTRVGTTFGVIASVAQTAVHPHARGDDFDVTVTKGGPIGSPPRAWGRPASTAPGRGCCRFTPTRVGTTEHPTPA